ncbi:MAG: putative DNA binding domain-containing protein [Lachnospiraceae bacterium]|nr:putative DNA binding domain-containing protein [Lachnospiraceae bacterium]
MGDLKQTVKELISAETEEEWFDFKENWYEPAGIGEYISSLSNAAAMLGKEYGYLIWGVNDKSHEIVGTAMDYRKDVKNEPLEHYLARQLMPDIAFLFQEIKINRRRIVVLVIPAAHQVPTAFNGHRFLRIGSSKVNLNKYPEREARLFDILRNGFPTIENTEADSQELTFRKLFLYYEDKGIILSKKTFKKNLGFLTKDGKYNLLAQLLSDNSQIPIRVSIFKGRDKTSSLYSVREFGNNSLLLSLDKVLEYGDVLNIIQADESNRIVERKEIPLFDQSAFREAVINAFVHNLWIDGNAPMITVYSDRIEILSRGTLPPKQTIQGFYLGESVPVNQKLSDIFLQLHISERSGRGVPKITGVYGKEAFEFRENSIVVTIPFHYLETDLGNKMGNKNGEYTIKLNPTRQRILEEMRNNPNVTGEQLALMIGIKKTAIENNISFLKKNGLVERMGSRKNGWWNVR